ncbi:hypothetical protein AVEN_247070-1 [Araneus ventricosus]|uniref:Uncharacterized protein n=1 Tax=Araneus ventricosus TaxID=182803 RepID=A0A4Y2SHU0_ARAVE|nr:hypothetical protein AVEN_247070-1 [Araneus ventricosus]
MNDASSPCNKTWRSNRVKTSFFLQEQHSLPISPSPPKDLSFLRTGSRIHAGSPDETENPDPYRSRKPGNRFVHFGRTQSIVPFENQIRSFVPQ